MEKSKKEVLSVRVTRELQVALEQECRRIRRVDGLDVTASIVVRMCLEKALLGKKRTKAARAA